MNRYLLSCLCLIAAFQIHAQDINYTEISKEKDLKAKWGHLEEVLEGKRIVALGEDLHGVKEYNATKLELIQYLHEELGYNVLALECDVARNFYGNLNKTEIEDTTFLKELFTPPWHTPEHLEIAKYVQSQPNLHIIGFDVEEKLDPNEIAKRLNIDLDENDPVHEDFQKRYAKWKEVNGRYLHTAGTRDSTMAEIFQWIAKKLYKKEKIIISAHNLHIAKESSFDLCMGELLNKKFKKEYYTIGLFHTLGTSKHVFRNMTYNVQPDLLIKNSIQYHLLQLDTDQLFLEVNQQAPESWFFKKTYSVTETYKYHYEINLSKTFDALIWIKEVQAPTYIIPNKNLER